MDIITFLLMVFSNSIKNFSKNIIDVMKIITAILLNHKLFTLLFPSIKTFDYFKQFFFSGNICLYLGSLLFTIFIINYIISPIIIYGIEKICTPRKMKYIINNPDKVNNLNDSEIDDVENYVKNKTIMKFAFKFLRKNKIDGKRVIESLEKFENEISIEKFSVKFNSIIGLFIQLFILGLFYLTSGKIFILSILLIVIILSFYIYLSLIYRLKFVLLIKSNRKYKEKIENLK